MSVHADDQAPVNFTDTELVEVRENMMGQEGLYARRPIASGTLIGCYAGRCVVLEIDEGKGGYVESPYEHRQVLQLHRMGNRMVGIVAIGGFRGVDYINHSCRPNVTTVHQLVVIATRDIAAGEEVTLDYRAWDSLREGIRCWCPEAECVI